MQLSKRTRPYLRETPNGMVLIASRTSEDAELQFPPPEFARRAGDDHDVPIGPVGKLYTFSIVHPGRDVAPYGLAMVDFEPGVRVFGRLLFEPAAQPQLDQPVKVVPFALADGTPDYAFKSAAGANHA